MILVQIKLHPMNPFHNSATRKSKYFHSNCCLLLLLGYVHQTQIKVPLFYKNIILNDDIMFGFV